jgi:protein TonB
MLARVAVAYLAGSSLLAQQPDRQRSAPEDVYFEFQVEKRVKVVPGNPVPRYPDVLRSDNVQGSVLVQFVVDTLGRADTTTFKVLRSTHDLFTISVRHVLPEMQFGPAEIAGRKVKQLVQMPFQFSITPASPPPPRS